MKSIVVTTVLLSWVSATATLFAERVDENTLPQSKRTSLGLYITAADAHETWKSNPNDVKVIDVRTPDEWRLIGYPRMAARISLTSSADQFVGQVKRVAQPKDMIFIICRSGNRSAVASEMLARAGFEKAYTVVDGFEGDRNTNPSSPDYGRRTVNGWKNTVLAGATDSRK
jgi:rhodanese-related sulfurtransferase